MLDKLNEELISISNKFSLDKVASVNLLLLNLMIDKKNYLIDKIRKGIYTGIAASYYKEQSESLLILVASYSIV